MNNTPSDLDALIFQLGSLNPTEKARAERALLERGDEAVDALQKHIDRNTYSARTIRQAILIGLSSVGLVTLVAWLLTRFNPVIMFAALCIQSLCMFGSLNAVRRQRRRAKEADAVVRVLSGFEDVRAVGPLVQMLTHKNIRPGQGSYRR